jgi:hypothetical protein
MNITPNRVDRLLTDVRVTHAIMSKYTDLPEVRRAMSHIEGTLQNLTRLRELAVSKQGVPA